MNQFFWPDIAPTGRLLADVACHLAREGYRVTAIAGTGSYALTDASCPPDVQIMRAPNLPFGRGKLMRVFSYASFFLTSLWCGIRVSRPDVVIVLTTPPLLALVAVVIKKLRGVPFHIWEMDLYPDVAVDLKVLKDGSVLTKLVGAVATYARREAESLIVLGECMRKRLLKYGISPSKIRVVENWVDGHSILPARSVRDPLTIVYAGNLGLAHDVDTISGAMLHFRNDERFRFIFVGGGAKSHIIRQFCADKQIGNAAVLPYQSTTEYNETLRSAALGLVTQTNASLGSLVPSKIYSMLAAGVPVLFIGPDGSTPATVISRFRCGWHVKCGDTQRLIRLLEEVSTRHDLLDVAARRAREAFLENYDAPVGIARFCHALNMP